MGGTKQADRRARGKTGPERVSNDRFPLARWGLRGYPPCVTGRAIALAAGLALLSSCGKEDDGLVTETRALTTKDVKPKLFATSEERFRDAKPSPVKAETPDGWVKRPSSQFRLLNYGFGATGSGEAYVSLASGSVLDNVNRWLRQFSADPLDQSGLDALRKVPIAGTTGVWVSARGEFAGAMGAPAKPDQALAGVIADIGGGRILTVKMTGAPDEVEQATPTLEQFAASLKLAD